ncbi:hypothetical protein DL93DRAFT_150369 [Clavulina sp. PMI_390]|nr:hypothetical protein DL93DRAFT_150369 [Clavulina sp. PMI_390]
MNSASWQVNIAQTRAMGAIANASRLRIAGHFASEVAINGAELGLNAAEVAEVEEGIGAAAEVMGTEAEILGVEGAIEGVVVAEEAFAAAAASTGIGLAVVGILFAAQYFWHKHKESQEADELREAISQLATARLYTAQTQQVSQVFVALSLQARDITTALIHKQPTLDLCTKYSTTAKELQADMSDDTQLHTLYESLVKQDNRVNTAEDPDLDAMKVRHQREIGSAKAKKAGK